MLLRGLGLILTILLWPKVSLATGNPVVINSFKIAGTKSTDEFVEILNTGFSKINITGWSLTKKTATGSGYKLVAPFPSAEINPGESIIVGHKDSVDAPDILYTSGYSIAEDNTIMLFSDDGKTLVDKVGFGKASDFEGVPLSVMGTDIWQRTGGIDSGNNAADFTKRIIGGNDYSGVCISELMPAPNEGDEWIEIYNSEVTKDIGGLVIADKLGSIKKYKVPAGIIIDEGQYLVFFAKDTGISLNNDGDGVTLSDQNGNIIDDTGEGYSQAPIGFSYAFDGTKWRWSKTPTPGAKNVIILDPVGETTTSKKRASSTTGTTVSKKGTLPQVEVLGAKDSRDNGIFAVRSNLFTSNDRLLGYILIGVAIFGGLIYTIFVNKEKLVEVFKLERKGYYKSWRRFCKKMQRWRDIPLIRRIRRGKDAIRQRFGKGTSDFG
jgi:hypothetical protein